MNITMENVVFIDQRQQMRLFDNFLVLARNIKYIHVPKEVNISFIKRNFSIYFSYLIFFWHLYGENAKKSVFVE